MANYYLDHHHYDTVQLDHGYESSSDVSTPWEQFSDEYLSPASIDYAYSMSPASGTSTDAPNTPAMHTVRPSTSRTSSSSSIPKVSPRTSVPETEEERRKNRKREQNRESQRAFRRRQENRVKFLEGKTLELEASSRQLRAENEHLRVALYDSRTKNDSLVATMNMMTPSPLSIASDIVPSIEGDRRYHYHQDNDPRVVW